MTDCGGLKSEIRNQINTNIGPARKKQGGTRHEQEKVVSCCGALELYHKDKSGRGRGGGIVVGTG